MNKVLVIGNCGSGKTTFARALAEKTGLPLVHLDRLYWHGNWEHLDKDAFDAALQQELEKPLWILDGNYGRTLPHRLSYCDTVFFLDMPKMTCLWGVIKRSLSSKGKSRQDMGGNCPEGLDRRLWELCRSVMAYNRKAQYARLGEIKNIRVTALRSRKDVQNFLAKM